MPFRTATTEVNVLTITEENFKQAVRDAEGVILVDFGAAWCGPCRAIKPLLEQLDTERIPGLTIVYVDVDAERDLAGQCKVASIPTLLLFKNGQNVGRMVGAQSLKKIRALYEPHLG